MSEAVGDFEISQETDPDDQQRIFLKNKSVILAATSAEHFLKSEILDIDWRDVFQKPAKATKSKLRNGSLRSKSFSECIGYLVEKSVLTKGNEKVFRRLAKQRNKIIHIGHNVKVTSAKSLIKASSMFLVSRVDGDSELKDLYAEQLTELKRWMVDQ